MKMKVWSPSPSVLYTRLAILIATTTSSTAFHPSSQVFVSVTSPGSTLVGKKYTHNKISVSASASATRLHMMTKAIHGPFPELVVFDLDACFWNEEMYTLSHIPDASNIVEGDLNGRGKGVVGVMSGRKRISLHAGSLRALQSHYDNKYPNMKVCFASSADTPLAEQIGRATLKLLEVVPGTTVWDLVVERDWDGVDVNQIGRQPPLSANKSATHFPILRECTRVRYDRMLFFDGKSRYYYV